MCPPGLALKQNFDIAKGAYFCFKKSAMNKSVSARKFYSRATVTPEDLF